MEGSQIDLMIKQMCGILYSELRVSHSLLKLDATDRIEQDYRCCRILDSHAWIQYTVCRRR